MVENLLLIGLNVDVLKGRYVHCSKGRIHRRILKSGGMLPQCQCYWTTVNTNQISRSQHEQVLTGLTGDRPLCLNMPAAIALLVFQGAWRHLLLLQRWHGKPSRNCRFPLATRICEGFPSHEWIAHLADARGQHDAIPDPTPESVEQLASSVREWHVQLQAAMTPQIAQAMANAVRTLEVSWLQ